MLETDWKAVLVDIGERISEELKAERSNKDSLAREIGYSLVRDSKSDTSSSIARIKQFDARIDGLNSSFNLIRGYLSGEYQLPKKTLSMIVLS